MKTIEEMAYGYACNKLGPNAQYDNSAEIGSLQNMLIDFTQKVLVEYNRWHDIETDKDGFATSESLDAIFDKIPCLVKYNRSGEIELINYDNAAEWRGDIERKPTRYRWRKIHE